MYRIISCLFKSESFTWFLAWILIYAGQKFWPISAHLTRHFVARSRLFLGLLRSNSVCCLFSLVSSIRVQLVVQTPQHPDGFNMFWSDTSHHPRMTYCLVSDPCLNSFLPFWAIQCHQRNTWCWSWHVLVPPWQGSDCKPGIACGYTLFDCTCISGTPRNLNGPESGFPAKSRSFSLLILLNSCIYIL